LYGTVCLNTHLCILALVRRPSNKDGMVCMDPSMIRVEAIPQEVRRKILDYVTNVKGVTPSER